MKKLRILIISIGFILIISIIVNAEVDTSEKKPFKVIAVPVEKLKTLSRQVIDKRIHKERALADLKEELKISRNFALGGVGAFKTRILQSEEIAQDPILYEVYKAQNPGEKQNMFVKTMATVQLFTTAMLPIEFSGSPISIISGVKLKGMIEIWDTRIVPIQFKEATSKLKNRIIRWPITVEYLKNELKIGESVSVKGLIEGGSGISEKFGKSLGSFIFGEIGTNINFSIGKTKDVWLRIHFKKIAENEVRVAIEKGDGTVTSKGTTIKAGLTVYDDEFIPTVETTTLDNSYIGIAVTEGKVKLINSLEKLLSSELSYSSTIGQHSKYMEGWGAVSLTKEKHVNAINQLLKFNPESIRAFAADETVSSYVDSGRLKVNIRDVTNDKRIKARLVHLQVNKNVDVRFYELKWIQDDIEKEHYLVGICTDQIEGRVTKFNRFEQITMWHDMIRDTYDVTVRLGPEKRIFTTQWEDIYEVITTQNALDLEVKNPHLAPPKPYIAFLNFGNFGKTIEKGFFHLPPLGIENISKATFDELLVAYLQADWQYEKGSIHRSALKNKGEKSLPAWSDKCSAEELQATLSFFRDHSKEVSILYPGHATGGRKKDKLKALRISYAKMTNGRNIISDNNRYKSAFAFATYVKEMQEQDSNPTKLIGLFLRLRKQKLVELKRACLAAGIIAGQSETQSGEPIANYSGYIEMKGRRVKLIPNSEMAEMPSTPLSVIENRISKWMQ